MPKDYVHEYKVLILKLYDMDHCEALEADHDVDWCQE